MHFTADIFRDSTTEITAEGSHFLENVTRSILQDQDSHEHGKEVKAM